MTAIFDDWVLENGQAIFEGSVDPKKKEAQDR